MTSHTVPGSLPSKTFSSSVASKCELLYLSQSLTKLRTQKQKRVALMNYYDESYEGFEI